MTMRTSLQQWRLLLCHLASRIAGRRGIGPHAARDVPPVTPAHPPCIARPHTRTLLAGVAAHGLQWRAPWGPCLMASWILGTATAPTFWVTGILLAIDAHSDHPAFWPSLMGIVAFVNATTIVRINQQQHRRPYICRETLARHYVCMSQRMGAALFLMANWMYGFLQANPWPAHHGHTFLPLAISTVLHNVPLAWLFALCSFTHTGTLHAWIGFTYRTRTAQP